jgi:chromosome segregation ATPase
MTPEDTVPNAERSHRKSTFLSEQGTWVNLSLAIVILVSTATAVAVFVRGMSKVDAVTRTADQLQASAESTNKVTSELNQNLVIVQGDLRNLSEKIGGLQADNKQSERDAQEHAAKVIRMETELQTHKERISALEANLRAAEASMQSSVKSMEAALQSAVKSLEARLLSLEIGASRRSGGSNGNGGAE